MYVLSNFFFWIYSNSFLKKKKEKNSAISVWATFLRSRHLQPTRLVRERGKHMGYRARDRFSRVIIPIRFLFLFY
jgi:hypothetical protein